uniref:Uncharacterized protein n=1 Tax=Meloidogyne floridensis TaxID=298350 RepID=A0A915P2V6_9BILA
MPLQQQPPLPINEDETAALLARTNDYGYIPPGYGLLNGNLLKEPQKQQQQQLILSFYSPQGMDNSLFSNINDEIIPQLKENIKEEEEDGGNSLLNKNKILNRSRKEQLALKIDRYSALLFPALFALFNVFYWYHYMTE